MARGIPKIKSLYSVLRSDDSDCLDSQSVIDIIKDLDRRVESIERAIAARLSK